MNELRIGVGTGLLVEDAQDEFMFAERRCSQPTWDFYSKSSVTANQTAAPDGTTTMANYRRILATFMDISLAIAQSHANFMLVTGYVRSRIIMALWHDLYI